MKPAGSRLRRNFVYALAGHMAVVVLLAIWQGKGIAWRDRAAVEVEIFTPADLLGDLPKGPGVGRGAYTPPKLGSGGAAPEAPAGEAVFAPEPRPARPPPPSPPTEGEVAVPRATARPTSPTRPTNAVASASRPATGQVARAATPRPTGAATGTTARAASSATARTAGSPGSPTGSPAGASAAEIRNRFARALQAEAGGTPYGDGRRAGGGSGSSPVIGSRDGSPNGVAGGVGRGSPFWWYYQQVHDRLYEAWVHPPEAVNWDRRQFATVVIKVARNGEIVAVRLLTPSGNRAMDESALAAVHNVGRLPPLPEGLGGATADITVNFQLEG